MPTVHQFKLKRGFTLVEIIIVLAIIALLAILIISALTSQRNKANDAKRKADLQKISVAMENYYSDEDCYPPETILNDCGGDALKPYLDAIPCDPVYNTPYCYLPVEPNTSTCYQKYRLLGTLKYLHDLIIKSLGCDGNQFCGWEEECAAASTRIGFNYGVTSPNISILNPSMPVAPEATPIPTPPLPTPAGGNWGCTPNGECNNYSGSREKCTYFFPDGTCGNGLYCGSQIYRCSP